MSSEYTTEQVARLAGATVRQIQRWSESGLIASTRTVWGCRYGYKNLYGPEEALRCMVIAALRHKGMFMQSVWRIQGRLTGKMLAAVLRRHRQVFLLTDGSSVFLVFTKDRVLAVMKGCQARDVRRQSGAAGCGARGGRGLIDRLIEELNSLYEENRNLKLIVADERQRFDWLLRDLLPGFVGGHNVQSDATLLVGSEASPDAWDAAYFEICRNAIREAIRAVAA